MPNPDDRAENEELPPMHIAGREEEFPIGEITERELERLAQQRHKAMLAVLACIRTAPPPMNGYTPIVRLDINENEE